MYTVFKRKTMYKICSVSKINTVRTCCFRINPLKPYCINVFCQNIRSQNIVCGLAISEYIA